jgi:acetylornithine deacetylase/succinyl-diaminopimelate desuccinylase-like protein
MNEQEQALSRVFAELKNRESETVELLRELVRIPTVNSGQMPTGHVTAACRLLQDYLSDFPTEIVEKAEERGSFVACWKNGSAGKRLLWMSHLDVVAPGDEALWSHPPFAAEIDNGRLFGRGAIDCKTMTAAAAAAMLALKRSGFEPTGELAMIAGADEECGGRYGFGHLAEARPELLSADLAINEGGGQPVRAADGGLRYQVGVGDKGRYEVTFELRGESGHASAPWRAKSPILLAAKLLERLDHWRPAVDVSPPPFRQLAELFGIEEAPTPANLDRLLDRIAELNNRLAQQLRVLSRMTIAPTLIQAGEKSNSIPDRCLLTCDARLLPGQKVEELEAVLAELVDGLDGASYQIEETAHASFTEPDEEQWRLLESALRRSTGDGSVKCLPSYCGGFTDSRFTRAAGAPTFGFQVTAPDSDPTKGGIHCIDESASLADLHFLSKTLAALAVEFLG